MTTARLKLSLAVWQARLERRHRKAEWWRLHSKRPWRERAPQIHKYHQLEAEAHKLVLLRTAQLKARETTLASKALAEASRLAELHIREQGGNNRGPWVLRIIRANGGGGPEPWCGDTVAWCYRTAGSKVVQRAWAAVVNLGRLTGMRVVQHPKPGFIVCYTFDHTGIFERWLEGGYFLAIEGNTGSVGAVSDSASGGDGVYRKKRHVSQVSRWVEVLR